MISVSESMQHQKCHFSVRLPTSLETTRCCITQYLRLRSSVTYNRVQAGCYRTIDSVFKEHSDPVRFLRKLVSFGCPAAVPVGVADREDCNRLRQNAVCLPPREKSIFHGAQAFTSHMTMPTGLAVHAPFGSRLLRALHANDR